MEQSTDCLFGFIFGKLIDTDSIKDRSELLIRDSYIVYITLLNR